MYQVLAIFVFMERKSCQHPIGDILLLPSVNDALEIGNLQRSATNQTTVNVRFCKEFCCITWFTATTVKDGSVFSGSLTVFVGYDATDVCQHLFCLVRSSGLTCTDGPNRLVSNDDILPLFSIQIKY